MAQNKGGEGKGHSNVPATSDEQDKIRRAARARRRANGTGGYHGETMTAGLQQDREARRAERDTRNAARGYQGDPRPYAERFMDRLGDAILKVAQRENWDMDTRKGAILYVRWLMNGGDEPTLTEQHCTTVRLRFALTCASMKAFPGSFPGQDQYWFESVFAEAEAILQRRSSDRQPANNGDAKPKQTPKRDPLDFRKRQAKLAREQVYFTGLAEGSLAYKVADLTLENFVDVVPADGQSRTKAAQEATKGALNAEELLRGGAIRRGFSEAHSALNAAYKLLTNPESKPTEESTAQPATETSTQVEFQEPELAAAS